MKAFSKDIKIRFEHCDPAGIVFYPHYFEMFNQMVEDWFDELIGINFQTMHQEWKLGVPLVHNETDFLGASRIGDILQFTLKLTRIGRKSITFLIEASKEDHVRVKTTLVLACVSLGDTLKGQDIPVEFKKRLESFLTT
jgi:4-hydroxybenzoyl-CoA thioesterase